MKSDSSKVRDSSILFNLVDIRGVVQHKWRMVLIRAMVQDFAFGERPTLFNSASPRWIEHQSFTLCEISYHCTINHSPFVYWSLTLVMPNANSTGSTGTQTRLGVYGDNSKCQIVHLPVEPALSGCRETWNGDLHGAASLHAPDSLITNVSL